MGLRFRRSLKLAPGVRLNLSKSGLGVSVGVRGASVSVGPRGAYANVGIPGTGISYREKLGGKAGSVGSRRGAGAMSSPTGFGGVAISLDDRGAVVLSDHAGNPLPPQLDRQVRGTQGAELRRWLEERCAAVNAELDAILNLHLDTPAPDGGPKFEARDFVEPAPVAAAPREVGLLGRIFRSAREGVEREEVEARRRHEEEVAEWAARRAAHEAAESRRWEEFEVGRRGDSAAMETLLAESFSGIEWPRETQVSFEIELAERAVYLDVDLPELEDLPTAEASVAGRGLRLVVKERSATQARRDYAWHIHAVLFRLVGEVFALLPSIELVVVSGYSQRPDTTTGRVNDEYLLSARVARWPWRAIDFGALDVVEVPAAFERFELRRAMTKTGIFKAIEPFELARSG